MEAVCYSIVETEALSAKELSVAVGVTMADYCSWLFRIRRLKNKSPTGIARLVDRMK